MFVWVHSNQYGENELLNCVFTQDEKTIKAFNLTSIMGLVIVPSQAFGFNYLGGKLLAAICCSHHVREMMNKKYRYECMFI